MAFPRRDYWSGLPFSSPMNLPDPGIKSLAPATSPALQADDLPPGKTFIGEPQAQFTQKLRVRLRLDFSWAPIFSLLLPLLHSAFLTTVEDSPENTPSVSHLQNIFIFNILLLGNLALNSFILELRSNLSIKTPPVGNRKPGYQTDSVYLFVSITLWILISFERWAKWQFSCLSSRLL